MKELCLDARMLNSSGIGTYLRNLILGLKDGPFRLHLIIQPSALQKYPWLASFDLIFGDFPIYSIEEQIKLPLLIPSCDLFWSPHFNIPLAPIRAKKRVVTIHDAYHLAFYSTLRPIEKLYAKYVIGKALKKSDCIITVSHFSKQELIKYTNAAPEKFKVIYHGVDQEEAPETFSRDPFVLFVGNVKPHKNLKNLAKAMEGVAGYSLVVAGKKTGFFHGENSAEFPPHVIFLGEVSHAELQLLYQKAALTVLPSFYEGFGYTPLEAMRWGCPTVVSKAASLKEICGNATHYVDPFDPNDIQKGILEVLNSSEKREALILQGKERIKLFTHQKEIEQHLSIFENLCG